MPASPLPFDALGPVAVPIAELCTYDAAEVAALRRDHGLTHILVTGYFLRGECIGLNLPPPPDPDP